MTDESKLSVEGRLFGAAKSGDVATLRRLIADQPRLRDVRDKPYEHSLLHAAAQHGQLAVVEYLIDIGADVNYREKGDNTVAMHWAAASGHLPIVKRLADAGGDIVGRGDDHAMEIIGWACMWDGGQDDAHRAIVDFLLSRGAKHHIFSAIAMDLPEEVRRIVRENPKALEQRQSHNESFRTPLHYAVAMNRPGIVELLMELGADPFLMDGSPWHYAPTIEARNPTIDLPILRAYAKQTPPALFALVALHQWDRAERLLRPTGTQDEHNGVLHLMAKRGDAAAVKWLLDHGFDPNALWDHYDARLTPLHLAAWGGHIDVVKALLDAGADPTIKDSKHDGNALDWPSSSAAWTLSDCFEQRPEPQRTPRTQSQTSRSPLRPLRPLRFKLLWKAKMRVTISDMRSLLLAFIGLSLSIEASAQARLNPVIELLEQKKPVFGLYAPANPRVRPGEPAPTEPAKQPKELAAVALTQPAADYLFDGSMERNFDRSYPVFNEFAHGLFEAGMRSGNRLRQPLFVKTPEVAPDPAAARERISHQLNLGVSGIVFVDVKSAAELEQGIAMMRFAPDGGTRPDNVGDAPKLWGMTEKQYREKADVWPLDPRGELVSFAIIESLDGLAKVREIAAVKGLGVLFPGAGTLRGVFSATDSAGRRVLDQVKWEAAIQQVLSACKEFNVPCGYPAGESDIEMRMKQGFSVFIIGWGAPGFRAVDIGRRVGGR